MLTSTVCGGERAQRSSLLRHVENYRNVRAKVLSARADVDLLTPNQGASRKRISGLIL